MEPDFIRLLIAVLGVWRLTHLLQAEDGPWDIVVRLRARAGSGVIGQMMDCFYCLSVWIALPFALAADASWLQRLALWPALSAGAILLERATARPTPPTTSASLAAPAPLADPTEDRS
jgi:hypothetical protein